MWTMQIGSARITDLGTLVGVAPAASVRKISRCDVPRKEPLDHDRRRIPSGGPNEISDCHRNPTELHRPSLRARLLIGCSVLLVRVPWSGRERPQTTSKPYTANIVPHQVGAGSSTTFTATLVNETDTQQLGSAEITAPPGFVILSVSARSP